MMYSLLATTLLLTMGSAVPVELQSSGTLLFDFTTIPNVDSWREVSDTVRVPGKSKGVLTLQKTQLFQRAVFFVMLNPQPNGACFAGSVTRLPTTITSSPSSVQLKVRAQGELSHWKVYFNSDTVKYNYEQVFECPLNDQFVVVDLPISDFKAYYHGAEQPDAPVMDLGNMTEIGVQGYGGVYATYKQSGSGSLEIDYISLV
eukprot:sb/3470626/